ncbi:MAG: SDR family NAD(P)-dependent oxidoreductase, partial [Burkholderiaceae bacterium]|nr:SDR family NAD(P)-dependent oxidoreductase [Burkholderiaceae bacterium]
MAQRIAYVTGGMGGIGTAICQRLSKGGFKVIAGCGPNSPRKDRWIGEQKALGYEFIAFFLMGWIDHTSNVTR